MSFLGTPVFEQIDLTMLRITGLSLPTNDSGTLGFSDASTEDPPDVRFPETFAAPTSSFDGAPTSIRALTKITINPTTNEAATNLQPTVEKTGDDGASFRAEIVNTNTGEPTQELEIYVELLGQVQSSQGVTVNVIDSPKATVNVR